MKYGRMNEPKGRLMNVNIPDDLFDADMTGATMPDGTVHD
jgi:hypothetical protein